jgi:hypothetical protein
VTGKSAEAFIVAGCGNTVAGLATVVSVSAPPTGTTTTTTSAPTTTTSTATTPPVTAAAGTNYKACRDGTCEVAIGGPVKIAVDRGTVTVIR